MKKLIKNSVCCLPLILWLVIIPVVVKVKFFPNPLTEYSWYSNEATLADFFLYYKEIAVIVFAVFLLLFFCRRAYLPGSCGEKCSGFAEAGTVLADSGCTVCGLYNPFYAARVYPGKHKRGISWQLYRI